MRTHSSCSSLALSLPLSLTLGPAVFPVKPVQPVPVPPFLVSLFSSAPTVDDTPRRHASPTPGPGPAHARHARPPPIFNLLLTRQTWRGRKKKKTPGNKLRVRCWLIWSRYALQVMGWTGETGSSSAMAQMELTQTQRPRDAKQAPLLLLWIQVLVLGSAKDHVPKYLTSYSNNEKGKKKIVCCKPRHTRRG